ncbi:MAG: biotin--[acetyl-CoA-carboxylase] ligase [Methyloligellaceae bacterium]
MTSITGLNNHITRSTHGMPNGYSLLAYEEIGSTNTEAMSLARDNSEDHLWLWTLKQTQGKGRNGRIWESRQGNLHASLILQLNCEVNTVAQLSLLAGVAAYDALALLCDSSVVNQIRLKWPNDLLLDGAKIGGILLESTKQADQKTVSVVLGTGMNLAYHPELDDKKTTNLSMYKQEIEPRQALESLAKATADWLKIWDLGKNFDQIREAWTLRGQKIGSPIKVNSGREIIHGHFAGLNETGGMILQLSTGAYKDVHFGDVILG